MSKSLILLGGGGHACVLFEILQAEGSSILGYTDLHPEAAPSLLAAQKLLGDDSAVDRYSIEEVELINGLGSTGSTAVRASLYREFSTKGYSFRPVVHARAILSESAAVGEGLQMMAGAVLGSAARAGENVLLNTGSIVDHDCDIGSHCHIATGAVVCGGCRLGPGVHIGAGATINQGISVGDGSIVASGAVVTKDIEPGVMVAGMPAGTKRVLG